MMSYTYNKYEQTMPSYLLSVNCFEDKAIYITKNIFQLTKYYLVPEGELLEFLRHFTYPQASQVLR